MVSASARHSDASALAVPGTTWMTRGHPTTAWPPTVHHTTYAPARCSTAEKTPRPDALRSPTSASTLSDSTFSVNTTSCGPDAATLKVCQRFHAVALPNRSRACMRTVRGSPATAATTPGPASLVPSSCATHDELAACPGRTLTSNGEPPTASRLYPLHT